MKTKKQPTEVDTIAFETYRDDRMKSMWDLFLQSRGGCLELSDEENQELVLLTSSFIVSPSVRLSLTALLSIALTVGDSVNVRVSDGSVASNCRSICLGA